MEAGDDGEITEIVVKPAAQARWLGHGIVTVLHQQMEDGIVPDPITITPHATPIDVQVPKIQSFCTYNILLLRTRIF